MAHPPLQRPAAEFLFVPDTEVMATAAREGATPYVPGVELGHHGERYDALCAYCKSGLARGA